jgi:hypothetical protein
MESDKINSLDITNNFDENNISFYVSIEKESPNGANASFSFPINREILIIALFLSGIENFT